ncbi:MAG: tetratricopeptide repeat protein [Candidatus Obscuribacter sp.]|nr:tetratricopeptide repeat protein [Candidatus Obscuribacter sp.]
MNKTTALLLSLTSALIAAPAFADAVSWEKVSKEALAAREGKELDKAVGLYRKAVEDARASALEPKFVALSLNDLGLCLLAAGQKGEAEKYLLEAIAVREKAYGAQEPTLVPTLGNLGQFYKGEKQWDKARQSYERAIAIVEKNSSDKDVKLIPLVNAMAALSMEAGNNEEALKQLTRVKELAKASGDKGAQIIALNNMAVVLRKLDRKDEAEALYKDVLALQGDNSPADQAGRGENVEANKAAALTNLARVNREKGQFDAAKPLLLEACELLEKGKDIRPESLITAYDNLATVSKELGDYADAIKYYRLALSQQEGIKDTGADVKAARMTNLALALVSSGEMKESDELFKKALALLEEKYGKDSPKVAPALSNLAELYRQQEKYDAAEPLMRRSFDIRQASLPATDAGLADGANDLALLYKEMGRESDSISYFEKSLSVREKSPDSPELATALNNLARSYRQSGKLDKAEELYKRALSMRERLSGASDQSVAAVLRNYAVLLRQMGRKPEARALDKRAQTIEDSAQ